MDWNEKYTVVVLLLKLVQTYFVWGHSKMAIFHYFEMMQKPN